jgi:membrane associated rhomboid family serine protease
VIPLRDNAPTRHFPVVTVALIVANVLVFFLYEGITPSQASVNELAFQPCEVDSSCPTIGQPWEVNVFTSMFMHADILHLGGNMLFLWIFGNNVEDAMGRVRYIVFYLLAGIAATALQTAITLSQASQTAAQIPNLGASGAISGVIGAYIVLLPQAKVLTAIFLGFIFFLREIPAMFFIGIWALIQLLQAGFEFTHPPSGGGVAVWAHIGGLAFGLLAVLIFRKRKPLAPLY